MTSRPVMHVLAAVVLVMVSSLRAAQHVTGDTGDAMSRVARYVEEYYSRAQSIMAVETVTVQNVTANMGMDGFARRFVYNLRVEWTPSGDGPPAANVSRELVSVNGRPPRPGDEPHCSAPKPITPEPLAKFLRQRQPEFVFSDARQAELDKLRLVRLDYRVREPEADVISWDRECVTMEFPRRLRGRVWVNDTSGEIVRIDEGAQGPVEIVDPAASRGGMRSTMIFERFTMSIRYRPVTFTDPDERLLLPASIESLSMTRSFGTRRTQTYSNYQRFVTGGRVLP